MRPDTATSPRAPGLTALGVLGFAAALAAASHVAIPLPGTPVPLTLQPLLVVLTGIWLGPAAGLASMLIYIAAGAAGLPVFAPTLPTIGVARLLGPTGGYILAYPLAAWLAGRIAAPGDRATRRLLAAVAGIILIHLGGIAQLIATTHSASTALALGSLPFVTFDAGKAIIAAGLTARRGSHPHG
jgi:biotin transport system substrate-specific component